VAKLHLIDSKRLASAIDSKGLFLKAAESKALTSAMALGRSVMSGLLVFLSISILKKAGNSSAKCMQMKSPARGRAFGFCAKRDCLDG
jgi:hypothetical protein